MESKYLLCFQNQIEAEVTFLKKLKPASKDHQERQYPYGEV